MAISRGAVKIEVKGLNGICLRWPLPIGVIISGIHARHKGGSFLFTRRIAPRMKSAPQGSRVMVLPAREDRLQEMILLKLRLAPSPPLHESLFLRGANHLPPNRVGCRAACKVLLPAGGFVPHEIATLLPFQVFAFTFAFALRTLAEAARRLIPASDAYSPRLVTCP